MAGKKEKIARVCADLLAGSIGGEPSVILLSAAVRAKLRSGDVEGRTVSLWVGRRRWQDTECLTSASIQLLDGMDAPRGPTKTS